VITASAHVDIERSPEEVWAILMDPAKAPLWEKAVVVSERLDDGPLGVGSRFRKTVSLLGRRFDVDFEIVEYRDLRHCSVLLIAGPITGGGSYSVEPVPGGTRLTYGLRHQMKGLLRMVGPVMQRRYPRLLARDLATLKLAVETADEAAVDRRN
jgi:carbon monoxide dehydrogenase subunit G